MPETNEQIRGNEISDQIRFSLIIDCRNGREATLRTVASIYNQPQHLRSHLDLVIMNGDPVLEKELHAKGIDSITFLSPSEAEQTLGKIRNRAKRICKGDVFCFLDAGGIFGANVLDEVGRFFQDSQNVTDVVLIPTKDRNPAPAAFKDGNRLTDLSRDESGFVITSVDGAFFNAGSLDVVDFFDEDHGIDLPFVTSVLSRNLKFGLASSQDCYLEVAQSPTPNAHRSNVWKFDILELGFIPVLENLSERFHGFIPKYFQTAALQEIRVRVNKAGVDLFETETELNKYRQLVQKLLAKINDESILNDSKLDPIAKSFLLAFKYGQGNKDELLYEGKGILSFRGKQIPNSEKQNYARIDLIEVTGKEVMVEGAILGLDLDSRKIRFVDANEKAHLTPYFTGGIRKDLSREFLGIKWLDAKVFKLKLDLSVARAAEVAVRFEFENGEPNRRAIVNAPIRFGPMSRIGPGRFVHTWQKGIIASTRRSESILLERFSLLRLLSLQALQTAFILKRHGVVAAIADVFHFFARSIGRHNRTWLFIDRRDSGGDNAEYVFREAMAKGIKNAHFVIRKDSNDYKRLRKKYRKNVIPHGSLRHRFHFLTCELLATSFATGSHLNYPAKSPSPRADSHTRFETVYLQHGVLASGVAHALNRHLKRIGLFVVATEFERRSLLEDQYLYSEKNIALTGQPRFDGLWEENTENVIMVAPTWRGNLAKILNSSDDQKVGFLETNFYKGYSDFLSDPKLHKLLNEHNFSLEFYLHPMLYKAFEFFAPLENARIQIMKPPNKYNYAMSRAALLITDYSGLAYDFAYTRKPLIYAHFDYAEFLALHPHAGTVFDFQANGFGPIAQNSHELLDLIEDQFKGNMIMDAPYKVRASEFFKFDDQNNSARTLAAIAEFDKSR